MSVESKAGQAIRRVLVGAVAGVVLGTLVWLAYVTFGTQDPFAGAVDPRRYQAVFLADGRVYFGNLRPAGEEFYDLRNAYFIEKVAATKKGAEPTQRLQPLSREAHEPENRVLLAKDQVVAVENLIPNSKVAAAIARARAGG